MPKVTIEINDTLSETVDQCIDELKELICDWVADNRDGSDPCLSNDIDYSGRVHEIIDSNVPIYYSEIDGLWYLYSDRFMEAYENAGFGDGTEENIKQIAIYCYLEQECYAWYSDEVEKYSVMDNWREYARDKLEIENPRETIETFVQSVADEMEEGKTEEQAREIAEDYYNDEITVLFDDHDAAKSFAEYMDWQQ